MVLDALMEVVLSPEVGVSVWGGHKGGGGCVWVWGDLSMCLCVGQMRAPTPPLPLARSCPHVLSSPPPLSPLCHPAPHRTLHR